MEFNAYLPRGFLIFKEEIKRQISSFFVKNFLFFLFFAVKSFDNTQKMWYSIIAFEYEPCRSTQEAQGAPLLRE